MARRDFKIERIGAEPPKGLPKGFRERFMGFPLSQPGDVLIGIYKGEGPKKKMKRGEPARIFRIQTESGAMADIIGSAQISTFLDGCKVGQTVYIERLGNVKGGRGTVNTYRCAVKE